jgi:hypothetical protein
VSAADRHHVIPHMPALILIVAFAVAASGCSVRESVVRRGTAITVVQRDVGVPDVIEDVSGDTGRQYVPTNRPAEEWPSDAPRTFYYLDRNLAVTFVRGRAVRTTTISDEQRQQLLSLVRLNQVRDNTPLGRTGR